MRAEVVYILAATVLVVLIISCTWLVAKTRYRIPRDSTVTFTADRFHEFDPSAPPSRRDAVWATSCNVNYVQGVLKLHKSMQNVGSLYPLVCFCTDSTSETQEQELRAANIRTIRVPLASIHNPYNRKWTEAFVKLECWMLPHERVCWIDSDTIQLQNCDELMDVPLESRGIACAVDHEIFPRSTDRVVFKMLQSGLFVLSPSVQMYKELRGNLGVVRSADGGDQGFLTSFYAKLDFRPVVFLSSAYNYMKRGLLRHDEFDLRRIKVLHFVGHPKPWKGGERGYETLQRIWEET